MISVICNPILFATLRVARIALCEPLPSSLLGDVRLVSSFVLRSAARDPTSSATLRVARIALCEPLPSSSLGDVRLVSSFVLRSAARDPRIVPRSRKVKPLMAR